ncbi:MAG: hypothetical protein DHS20C18_37550 [Saprospiraceae bacterium]|nr:MAG: hypothetical protein DHS20C18_37550 [Saprospiraceae bacterium]
MKNVKWILMLAAMTTLSMFACTNNPDDTVDINNLTDVLEASGDWEVTYYWDKDKDETSDFASYTFRFKENGVFEGTRNGTTQTGTWSVDNSSQKLIINIGTDKPLTDLIDDWIILEKTDRLIKLKDDNDEHLEELHFERI